MSAERLVAEIANTDIANVASAPLLANILGWDSLKMVHLVVRLEKEIGRELTEQEIETLSSVRDVARLLPADNSG
jgi:acyl carrier protein